MRAVDVAEAVAPYVAEFVGTFFVIFSIGCNAISGDTLWMPTSIAFAIMVTMYATSAVSGGHLNPTVSIALGLSGKVPWLRVGLYVVVQVAAGLVAAAAATGLLQQTIPVGVRSGFSFIDAAVLELIFSTTVAFVALNCMASSRTNPPGDRNQFFALAVGFVAIAGGHCTSDISGAFFNPAATIGYGITSNSPLFNVACYVGCQVVAANAAVILYYMVRPEELAAAIGAAVDGLSLETACRALPCCSARPHMGSRSEGHDEESTTALKITMYENYAVQVSARWLAELLGTFVVTFTFVLASVNHKMYVLGKLGDPSLAAARNAAHPLLLDNGIRGHMTTPNANDAKTGEDVSAGSTVSWATGAAVVSLAYALGNVSGAHFNPAVTLGVVLSRRPDCSFAEGTSFLLAQGGAAVGAALTVCTLHREGNSLFNEDRVLDMGPNTKEGYTWSAIVCGETVFTAAMAMVSMCMLTVKSPRYPKAPSSRSFQFALATGMCYTAGSYALEDISGGHLNPAISLGVAASNFVSSGFQELNTKALLWFTLSQALGGVVAAIVFVLVHPFEYKMDPLLAGQQLAFEQAKQEERTGLERRLAVRTS